MTVFPISNFRFLSYAIAIPLFFLMGSAVMATNEISGAQARSRVHGTEQLAEQHGADAQTDRSNLAAYSFSSPEFRQSLRKVSANSTQGNSELLDEEVSATPAPVTVSQLPDNSKVIDPCTKQPVDIAPPPLDKPNALESVKRRDPDLYNQIHAKVKDPRYTGELGNITVSTHDKKGRISGCTFVQNVPYWESGPAAQSLVDVNIELAKRGLSLHADPLNGAGRTRAQEEAIVWRNSGLHAKVGKSNHGFGNAIDFNDNPAAGEKHQLYDDPFVNSTLHAHGWRQGDSHGPLKNDLHHWSFVGPGAATDGPPPQKTKHGHGQKHHR